MISSKALRRISARSRGLRPAQSANAACAASTAAMASSTVALATEAMVFSVAGSMTSKRPPSDALRHLPPIHRSVGTLARRFSYMDVSSRLPAAAHSTCAAEPGTGSQQAGSRISVHHRVLHRVRDTTLSSQTPPHRLDDARRRRQHDVFQIVGGRQRDVRRGDAHRRAVEIVEGLVGDDRHDLGAPAAQPRVFLDREQAVRARRPNPGWSGCRAAPASARRSPRSRCRVPPASVLGRGQRARHHQRQAPGWWRPCRAAAILAVPSVSTISPSGTSPLVA